LISIPIFVIEAGFFNMVIPSATLHKILHSYYTRAISYALLSVPGFVYLPTLFGSLGLVASGLLVVLFSPRVFYPFSPRPCKAFYTGSPRSAKRTRRITASLTSLGLCNVAM